LKVRVRGCQAGIAASAALALAAVALAAAPDTASAAFAKILSPKDGAHIRHDTVVARTRTKGKRFRAHLDGKDVTSRFVRTGPYVRRAVLTAGRDFGRLDSNLQIRVGPRLDATIDSTTFIHMQRVDGVGNVKAKQDALARPVPRLRARSERRLWESKVLLNGDRVREDLVHHPDEKGLSFGLGPHHGLRYGRNEVTVELLQRNGKYARHVRGFRVPRDRILAGAGPDRTVGVGETVSLDGTSTRLPPRGHDVDFDWTIVNAPPRSEATLDQPTSAQPLLTPDVAGEYTVRLTADATGRVRAGVDEVTVTAPQTADPMGVPIQTITSDGAIHIGNQKFPRCGPWVQVVFLWAGSLTPDTRYNTGGCAPGAMSFNAQQGSSLVEQVQNVDTSHVVIISGQGKPVSGPGVSTTGQLTGDQSYYLDQAIEAIGGTTASYGPTPQGAANLGNGEFSVLGNRTLTEGHAEQNFFITQAPVLNPDTAGFPTGPGAPGSLNGFMQNVNGPAYQYVSTDYVDLDTRYTPSPDQAPPTNQNTIKVGDQLIASGTIQGDEGEVAIQLVVLGQDRPNPSEGFSVEANETWRVLRGDGTPDFQGVYFLARSLDRWVRSNRAAESSQLVIVQDFGAHFGWNGPGQSSVDWVSDTLPDTSGEQAWEGDLLSLAPGKLFESWNEANAQAPDSNGPNGRKGFGTVAGNIGMLAGSPAHDAVANYRIPFFNPAGNNGKGAWTSNDSPGLSAVASTSLYQWSSAYFQGQQYPAHQSDPRFGSGRVTGILRRNEQSQWELTSSSPAPGYSQLTQNVDELNQFNPKALWDLVFQEREAWPCSEQRPSPCPIQPTQDCPTVVSTNSSSEIHNAMLWMAQHYQPEQGKGFTDIRQLYADAFENSFVVSDLPPYPGNGNGFSRPVFEGLRCQLALEFGYIKDVGTGIGSWQNFFNVNGDQEGYVNVKGVSSKIQQNLTAVYDKVATEDATADAAGIGSDFLYAISSLIEVGLIAGEVEDFDIAPSVLGGMGAAMGLGDDLFSETSDDGASSSQQEVTNDTEAIRDTGQDLARDVNARYQAINRTMEHFGNVFVSDWGKLQQASQNFRAGGVWQYPSNVTTQDQMALSMSISAQRSAYDALLPQAFTQWIVSPSEEDAINPSGPRDIGNRNPYRCVDTHDSDGYDDQRNPFDHVSLWALHTPQWIGEANPQIGSDPQGATPYTLRGLKSKADDMEADDYPYSDDENRVGLAHSGTTAQDSILSPLFGTVNPFEDPSNPSALGARKDEVFGLGSWNTGGEKALKKLQCA